MQDPNAALVRHHLREAARRRLRDSQRRALLSAARLLIPDHGLAMPVSRIAAQAGLSAGVARAMFNATNVLAIELVVDAWTTLAHQLARCPGESPAAVIAWLIGAIRADVAAHRIRQAIRCGMTDRQDRIIAEADSRLARAIADRLRDGWPGLPPDDPAGLGRRAIALASQAALAPAASDATAEAALIAQMLAAAVPAAPAVSAPLKPVPWTGNQSSVIRFPQLRGRGPVGNA